MKKMNSFLMAMLLLLSCVQLPSLAQDAASYDAIDYSSALDVVIVMDQSKSMDTEGGKNDVEGYRLDAAQMMIGMLDTKSRVAFVTFAGTILKGYDTEFHVLNTLSARNNKTRHIEALRNQQTTHNTDLGEALQYALKLLMERDDKRREPMIIALTDGSNQLPVNGVSKDVWQWDTNTRHFRKVNYRSYSVKDANALMDSAIDLGRDHQIPIFTIALSKDSTTAEARALASKLAEISEQTRGKAARVSEAAQLPEFFGQLFADRIGSTVLPLVSFPVDVGTGRYAVNLPILNQSVTEANIFVSLEHIARAGDKVDGLPEVRLVDKDGNPSSGLNNVLEQKSKNFLLYKIERPDPGTWRLEYTLKDPAANSNIIFSLLYNYNIDLEAHLSRNGNPLTKNDVLNKSDALTLTARFVTSDGSNTTDRNLYAVHEENKEDNKGNWQTIKASYVLEDSSGRKYSGSIAPQGDRFEIDIDLKKLNTDPDSAFNLLKSGQYTLSVNADGAGLHRKADTQQLQITNSAPKSSQDVIAPPRKTVDDPEKRETREEQPIEVKVYSGKPGDITSLVFDPDNDQLSNFVLKPEGEVFVELAVKEENGAFFLKGNTIKKEDGLFKYGISNFILTFKDSEGASTQVPVKVTVSSVSEELLKNYKVNHYTDGIDADGVAQKNSELRFSVSLSKQDGTSDTKGEIRKYEGIVDIRDAKNTDRQIEEVPLELNDDGRALVAHFTTPNHQLDAEATIYINVKETGQEAAKISVTFIVTNHVPQVIAGVEDQLPEQIAFDPLPEFLSFLEKITPPEQLNFDLSQMFRDQDNEDKSAFKYALDPVNDSGQGQLSNDILAVHPGNQLAEFSLEPLKEGTVNLTFSVTDGDGEVAMLNRSVKIYSLMQKWQRIGLVALAAFSALIVLILIIHQARKPRFPNDGVLLTMENDSIYPSDRYEFVPTKKHLPLGRLLNDDLVHKFGITQKELSSITLRPKRNRMGSIAIDRKKPSDRLLLELDGIPVGKKPMIWEKDRELTLRKAGDTQTLRVQFVRMENDDLHSETPPSWDDQQSNDFFNS